MPLTLTYDEYLDRILGGWIGKSLGGAVGARFEGDKRWLEIGPDEMFPETIPPNDDLDLQVLWLKVLEEKGASLTADDLAQAWLEDCWYPFNEYGIFRKNWRLGIHPPYSGSFGNEFWETGMGCPIRAEIWGYVFPGAPDLAAAYAARDGSLDHTAQAVGAEQMLAAMAAMAFFVPDVKRLAEMFIHYLPAGTPIERLTRAALAARQEGLSLREARERIMALAGHPEACDAQINVPFTFLGLLYGDNDLEKTLLAALKCGYDTDCTLATSAALIGQILGARRIPSALKERIGDQLVMGIRYRRPEMTLTALARDTARVGVLLSQACQTGVVITGAPPLPPLPDGARPPATRLEVDYEGAPAAMPGEAVRVTVRVHGALPPTGAELSLQAPEGWVALPATAAVSDRQRAVSCTLHAPADVPRWPMRHLFTARLAGAEDYTFGVAGAALWQFLGVYYEAPPMTDDPSQREKAARHHVAHLHRPYIPEPPTEEEVASLFSRWSRLLGRPAVVAAPTHRIDVTSLIGLRGPCCVYLARTVICPDERDVYIVVGNNDAYRLYLNGELLAERDEVTWWTPFNNVHPARLRAGPNRLVVKLLRHGDVLDFSLGIRHDTGRGNHNCEDWCVDLTDVNPLAGSSAWD